MPKLKNIMGSAVIFFLLVVLIVNFWGGFETSYDIQGQENLQNDSTVFEKLQGLNLLKGINELQTGIYKLTKIGSADFDILGGLAASAVGVLQTIGGMVTFPIDIIGVITGFYEGWIPPIITKVIGFIVVIAIAVLLISAKLGFDFT